MVRFRSQNFLQLTFMAIMPGINPPRHRYAGRPSLWQAITRKKNLLTPFARSGERVGERSNDRVSRMGDLLLVSIHRYKHIYNT